MKIELIKIFASILFVLICMVLFWYGGVDFGGRGFIQAYAIAVSLFFGCMVYCYPGWED